jgi:hypothetical protein
VDAGLAVITPPPQGSGHQPWQAVKRWTSSPCGDFEPANNNPKSGQVASVKTESEHDSLGHARLARRPRHWSVIARREKEFSESLDIRPHLNKLDVMLPVKEYHR